MRKPQWPVFVVRGADPAAIQAAFRRRGWEAVISEADVQVGPIPEIKLRGIVIREFPEATARELSREHPTFDMGA